MQIILEAMILIAQHGRISSGDPIEIDGFTNVSISVDLLENGNKGWDDYIRVQYNIGSGWVDFENEWLSRK